MNTRANNNRPGQEKRRMLPRLQFYQSLYAFAVSETGKPAGGSPEQHRHFSPYPPYFPLLGKIRRGGKSIS